MQKRCRLAEDARPRAAFLSQEGTLLPEGGLGCVPLDVLRGGGGGAALLLERVAIHVENERHVHPVQSERSKLRGNFGCLEDDLSCKATLKTSETLLSFHRMLK